MSWVCPICSTNNEDSENKCIVCDYEYVLNRTCTLTLHKVKKLGLSGNVVVPDEFNVIGEGAFKGRNDVYSVTLHRRVRKVSKEAFCGCENLREITTEGEIDSIGIRAFADCPSLPESARITAKYTAKDAYYITPKPIHIPPPPPADPSVTAEPEALTETRGSKNDFGRLAARLILMCLSLPIVFPLAFWFSSSFQDGDDLIYSVFIGGGLLLLLISYLLFGTNSEEREAFSTKFCVILLVLALLVLYGLSVIWGDVLVGIGGIITAASLLVELISMGLAIKRKQFMYSFFWICLIAVTGALLVRIIVA